MTTYDNAEPLPDWVPECRCGVCHTCLPAMRIPDSIILGEN